MKRIYTILLALMVISFSKKASCTVCYPTSGSWNAISFNIGFGVNIFHIDGYSGSVLHDTGIVNAAIAANWETGYLDRTALAPVMLQQGTTYTSYAGWYTATYRQDVQVWIDFNDDGLFSTTEEVSPVSGWNVSATPNPTNFSITIPSGATLGTHRMRMRSVWEQAGTYLTTVPPHLDPCYVRYLSTNPTYRCGDIVDYYAQIVPTTACAGTPTAGTVSAPSAACSATNFSLSLSGATFGTGLTYQWQSSPDSTSWTNISGATTITYVTSQTTNTYYRCRITCAISAASVYTAGKKVTTDIPAVVGSITGTDSVCIGSSITLSNSAAGGVWTTSSSLIATVSSTGITTGVTAGTATISYSITNSCGTARAIKVVTVNPLPYAGTLGSGAICAGTSTMFIGVAPGGVWSTGSTAIATVSTTGVVTGVAAGTTPISYVVTNSCGTDIAIGTVTVNIATPPGTIVGTLTLCPGTTTTVEDAVPGGVWGILPATIASISTTGLVTGLYPGTATIYYTVTSGCGVTSATEVVTVNPMPVAGVITGSTKLCMGSEVTLSSSVPGGSWFSGAISVATVDADGIVSGLVGGTALISYSITNFCGTAYATKLIKVETPLSPPTITGWTDHLCPGETLVLAGAPGSGTWTSTTGNASVTAGVVTGVSGGADTIIYTITNSCGPVSSTYPLSVWSTEVCDSIAAVPLAQNSTEEFVVFPNPAVNTITVSLSSHQTKSVQFVITNIMGQVVASIIGTTNKDLKLNVALPPGLFYITAQTDNNTRTEKLVIAPQ